MRYTVRLKCCGDFPGSPDYDEWEVDDVEYSELKERFESMLYRRLQG